MMRVINRCEPIGTEKKISYNLNSAENSQSNILSNAILNSICYVSNQQKINSFLNP